MRLFIREKILFVEKKHDKKKEISIFARHNYIVYLIGKNNSDGIVLKVWPNDLNARVISRKFDHTYITLNFIAIASDFDGEFRKIAEKSSCDLRVNEFCHP